MPLIAIHTQNHLSFASIKLLLEPCLHGESRTRISHVPFSLVHNRHSHGKLCLGGINIDPSIKIRGIRSVAGEYQQDEDEDEDEDEDVCPVECVREFKTDEEFCKILDKAKRAGSLVVVDFFRTSCGSCKYIEQGFAKLCRKSGNHDAPVIFLKHNVIDEYDEESEVAERLRIRAVPLFHFYKDGILLEAFPTRDKARIVEAILKYSSLEAEDILI